MAGVASFANTSPYTASVTVRQTHDFRTAYDSPYPCGQKTETIRGESKILLQNEYLAAENRILRAKLPSTLRLSNPERATLADRWPVSPNPTPSWLGIENLSPRSSMALNIGSILAA